MLQKQNTESTIILYSVYKPSHECTVKQRILLVCITC